jgi:hypothetical protein
VTESTHILESTLGAVTHEVQSTNRLIGDTAQEIAALSTSIFTMSSQLTTLTSREESIRASRGEELSTLERRA